MNTVSRAYHFVKKLPADVKHIQLRLDGLEDLLSKYDKNIPSILKQTSSDIYDLKSSQADILHSISEIKNQKFERNGNLRPTIQAYDHSLDSYYLAFEEKFRGTEEEIYQRIKSAYKTPLAKLPAEIRKLPFLDMGCGRGEFLKLYRELGLMPIGVDVNKSMVDTCRKKGFEVHEIDGMSYLLSQKSKTIGGISGIHLVEHIEFPELITLLSEVYRTLEKGGIALFETPNPENLSVGAFSFWYDASHLKPLPPEVLEFCMEYIGFVDVKILRLHPDRQISPSAFRDKKLQKIVKRFFGPRDYAVMGFK